MPGNFFDTNVLAYIVSDDPARADRAEDLLRDGGMISVQVLNELANVCRRKLRRSWDETNAFLTTLRDLLKVHPLTVETHESGLILSQRFQLSIYDGMIAASALDAGCDTLWSEDMQDGLMIANHLRVINPFRSQ